MKKYVTFTNIIVVLAIIVYILNLYVISPDTGYVAQRIMEEFKGSTDFNNVVKLFYLVFGSWGGHLNAILGFHLEKALHGEIWRFYTIVLTHAHLPHIVMNLIALIIAGNHIEKKEGTKKTIIFFLILMIINNLIADGIYFKLLGNEIDYSLGASGWITTLLGMILMRCILDKKYAKKELTKGQIIYLIIYFVSTTFVLMPNMFTIIAHMSGLIAGMITEYLCSKVWKINKFKA